MYAGIYPDQATFAAQWACETEFEPNMDAPQRQERYGSWQRAVDATLKF
jgi:glycerol kinase